MINAQIEFLEHTKDRAVRCAELRTGPEYLPEEGKFYRLPLYYTAAQYQSFILSLGFNYDDGYGGQELFGTIWYEDGTWSERGEYDGSEWWEHKSMPPIPPVLTQRTES